MESNSEENRVHMSEAAADLLANQAPDLRLEPRKPMNIKGKGRMKTFFLLADDIHHIKSSDTKALFQARRRKHDSKIASSQKNSIDMSDTENSTRKTGKFETSIQPANENNHELGKGDSKIENIKHAVNKTQTNAESDSAEDSLVGTSSLKEFDTSQKQNSSMHHVDGNSPEQQDIPSKNQHSLHTSEASSTLMNLLHQRSTVQPSYHEIMMMDGQIKRVRTELITLPEHSEAKSNGFVTTQKDHDEPKLEAATDGQLEDKHVTISNVLHVMYPDSLRSSMDANGEFRPQTSPERCQANSNDSNPPEPSTLSEAQSNAILPSTVIDFEDQAELARYQMSQNESTSAMQIHEDGASMSLI